MGDGMMEEPLANFRPWTHDIGIPNGHFGYLERFFPELYKRSLDRIKELEHRKSDNE